MNVDSRNKQKLTEWGWKWHYKNTILVSGVKKVTSVARGEYLVGIFSPLEIVSNVFMRNVACPLMLIGKGI